MNKMYENNKLIRKTILSMFGGSLAATITAAVALMADTLLAGVLFDKLAVAAVAVGTPIINIFQALNQTIINGASVKMSIAAGKGDNEEVQDSFTVAIFLSILMGVIFILGCQFFARPLVMAFGASPEIVDMTIWYLRGSTGCILFLTINLFLSKTLALYGKQRVIFRSALRSFKEKSSKLSLERILCIDKEIRDNVPKIDISINSDNRDVSFVSGQAQEFLLKENVGEKIAYATSVCLE